MYQQAWRREPPPGVGHALHAVLGLTALLLGLTLLYLARALVGSLPWSDLLLVVVSASAGLVVFTTVPWLLLDRRVGWRRLLPTGVLTAGLSNVYGIASTIYMPRLMETYSRRYGLFGVTLALVGWLLAIAVILVASAVVAAEFDRAPEPWARRLRGRFRIEPPAPGPATTSPATGSSARPSGAAPDRSA
jgi:membrane protein